MRTDRGAFPLTYEGNLWTCPHTGIEVPKSVQANLLQRQAFLEAADENPDFASQLVSACRQSPLLWFNLFAWTYRLKVVNDAGRDVRATVAHVPFITYPVQDPVIEGIVRRVREGGDICIDKSRDMGATWLACGALFWMWLFENDTDILVMSRKEELVDGGGKKSIDRATGNKDTLFWKFDYLLEKLPEWMKPKRDRMFMQLENIDRRSTLNGEATTSNSGQGGRRTAIFLDEFARVPNGEDMLTATADTTATRIFCSTPNGAGTAYTDKVRFGDTDVEIHTLGWWNHPEKARDREKVLDEFGEERWTSAWYENECRRRTPREIKENLDIEHIGSGDQVFDRNVVERHRERHCRPADERGEVRWYDVAAAMTVESEGVKALRNIRELQNSDKRLRERQRGAVRFDRSSRGRWRVWMDLDEDGHPPQETSYVVAADVGNGQGESNSVIVIGDVATRRKVAEFACPNTEPNDLGRLIVAAAYWVGGISPAYVIYEGNGPGANVSKMIRRLGYGRVHRHQMDTTRKQKKTDQLGWMATPASKPVLLEQYEDAMRRDELINPSDESLDECLRYVIFSSGDIGPGHLRDRTTGARKNHGDRVIADALLRLGFASSPRHRAAKRAVPWGSIAQRRRDRDRKRRAHDDNNWLGDV